MLQRCQVILFETGKERHFSFQALGFDHVEDIERQSKTRQGHFASSEASTTNLQGDHSQRYILSSFVATQNEDTILEDAKDLVWAVTRACSCRS